MDDTKWEPIPGWPGYYRFIGKPKVVDMGIVYEMIDRALRQHGHKPCHEQTTSQKKSGTTPTT